MVATQRKPAEATSEREIVITRVIDAPRELVWQAWSEQRHVERWWGPDGFTNTFTRFELRPGGCWVFTMHGPDGTDYPNLIEFEEVVPPERLVFRHSDGEDGHRAFQTIVTFEVHGGGTRITLHNIFPTREERDRVVEEVGAIEGGKQTLARCAAYVAEHLA